MVGEGGENKSSREGSAVAYCAQRCPPLLLPSHSCHIYFISASWSDATASCASYTAYTVTRCDRLQSINLVNHATPLHCHCTTGYAALTYEYVAAYAVSTTLSTLFNVSKYLTNEMPLCATSLSFSPSPSLSVSLHIQMTVRLRVIVACSGTGSRPQRDVARVNHI